MLIGDSKMKVRNGLFALSNEGIRFTQASSAEAGSAPWGQFDRIQEAGEAQAARDGWREIIDRVLIEWGRYPESVADDGVDPPTAAAIASASQAACRLRDEGISLPTNVAPTGDGGIAFEYELSNAFLTIEIDSVGDRELRVFQDGKIVRRSIGRLD